MAKIHLDILTPKRSVYQGDVEEVVAPGADGLFGVRPGHAPMVVAMAAGRVTYTLEGKKGSFRVGAGFVTVEDDKVAVLADSVIE